MIRWSPLSCIYSWQINRSGVHCKSRTISRWELGILSCMWTSWYSKLMAVMRYPLILWRPFLSTIGVTIDVAARIKKLNISRKEETSTFKPKHTEKCNQVMVTIRLERNAMTPDKNPSAAENFSTKFSRCVKNATPVVTRSPISPAN
jgi:hypothetical protein